MNAAMPPEAWALATACRATVVLPEASGPYTSTTRPRGRPPTPRAMSRATEPVGITFIATSGESPRRMTDPLPNCLSIWARAMSRALSRSSVAMMATFGCRCSGSSPTLGRGSDSFRGPSTSVDGRRTCGRHGRPNTCSIPVTRRGSCDHLPGGASAGRPYLVHCGPPRPHRGHPPLDEADQPEQVRDELGAGLGEPVLHVGRD